MVGSKWDKASVGTQLGEDIDVKCQYCGADYQTTDHLLWFCPSFDQVRKEDAPNLACLSKDLLPPSLRRGIPPAMVAQPHLTFWGEVMDGVPEHISSYLGCSADGLKK